MNLFTPRKVADLLGVHVQTVYRNNSLPKIRLGRGILEVALFDYINEYFTDCIEQKEKYNPEILMWFIGFCLDEFRGN